MCREKLIESAIHSNNDKDFNIIKEIILENSNCDSFFVEIQNQVYYALDEELVFTIKPDFLIKNSEGEVIAVADTKYKRLNRNKIKNYGISSSDVYQLLSYAYKFNTNKIILIYPKPPKKEFINDLSFTIKNDSDMNNSKILYICYVDLIEERDLKEKELTIAEEAKILEVVIN
ncbi:MAG: hypothetical protein IPN89_11990 [Saprospiraceae bacterium]|nr:hypothetical protein [Saprospiraceae bacterium]